MKQAFDQLQQIFPEMPKACEQALMTTVYSVQERKRSFTYHSARRAAILLAAMLAVTCAAGAAFYPQIINWFVNHYGQAHGAWMEKGSIAIPNGSVEENGAVFTIDEVLVRGRGLYVLGTIRAEEGYILVDSQCSAQEPWGYNIHYGETAPEGTPTIYQKAEETGCAIRYVHCDLSRIGVDGGALLKPGVWGYGARVQQDGSIVFTMEVEDGMVVEPGREYTLEFCAQTYGVQADGSINEEDMTERVWQITVVPEMIDKH
ncbi:MAG: hypothetical protein IJ461_04360 [Clostridia bacterium]|nr:hypothetical protein [Clostridia bacterium]